MNFRGRRVISGLAALTLGALTASGGAAVAAMPGAAAPSGGVEMVSAWSADLSMATAEDQDGSRNFAACVRGERSGRLVLLLDESGSLQDADPDAVRVDAATHLLRSWAQQVRGSDIDLQVQVMGFSSRATASTDWLPVTETDVLVEDVETYRDKNEGGQTDHLMGLNAARSAVSDAGSSCRAVVWFSDGRLDVQSTYQDDEDNTILKPYLDEEVEGPAATLAAREEICRAGGASDQLRISGVNLLAIGLASELTSEADFDLMKSAATETSCGESQPSGSFFLADDLEALLFAFANVARAEKPIVQEGGVCQAEITDDCQHKFVLDDSISGVSLMVTSEQESLDLVVIPPEGEPSTLTPSEEVSSVGVQKAQAEVRRLSARTSSVELSSDGGWAGVWGVALVDPASNSAAAKSQSSLHLTPDVQPMWISGDPLRSGEAGEVQIGLQRADGSPIDPAGLLGDLSLDVDFVGPDGQSRSLGQGLSAEEMGDPLALDLGDVDPGRAQFNLELNLITADFEDPDGETIPGTVLAPMAVTQRTQIEPPMGMPSLGEGFSFGRVLDSEEALAELDVTGPGCVWIDPGSAELLAAPTAAVPAVLASTADSLESCLRVEEGQTAALPLQMTTAGASVGGLEGTVNVHLTPLEDQTREVTLSRPFSADLDKTPNQAVFWTTALGLVAGAVLIPLGLLYGIKRWASRIPGRGLLAEAFPLDLDGDRVVSGIPTQLGPEHFRQPVDVPRKGATRLEVGPAQLSTAPGLSPLGVGQVKMVVPGMVGVSDTSKRPTKQGAAQLPLSVHDHWAVFREPNADHGLLIYMTSLERPRTEVEEELRRLTEELERDLRAIDSSGVAPAKARSGETATGTRAGAAAAGGATAAAATPAVFSFDGPDASGGQDWDFSTSEDGTEFDAGSTSPQGASTTAPGAVPDRHDQRPGPSTSSGDDFDFDFGSDPTD